MKQKTTNRLPKIPIACIVKQMHCALTSNKKQKKKQKNKYKLHLTRPGVIDINLCLFGRHRGLSVIVRFFTCEIMAIGYSCRVSEIYSVKKKVSDG